MIGEGGSEIAVILLDGNGTIVDAHASCAETFGWERGELLGKDVRELLQYGRDLLMNQLLLLEDEAADNTSFSVRVLAKRKDNCQFPARATVRRFRELECWTVAFYKADTEIVDDSQVPPSVSAEEIALAKRALEEGTVNSAIRSKKQKTEVKGEGMSVSRLWRNSRLLFSTREDKPLEVPANSAVEDTVEEKIARDSVALAHKFVQAAGPAPVASPIPPLPPTPPPAAERVPAAERPVVQPEPKPLAAPSPSPSAVPAANVPPPPTRHENHAPANDALPGLARAKAELEKERGERTRIEQRCASLSAQVQSLHLQLSESLNLESENTARIAEFERELRDSRDTASQVSADLDAERRERQSAEEHVALLKDLNARLEESLRLTEARTKSSEKAQLETRDMLTRCQASLRETEVALDKEREARQKVEQGLASTLREHRLNEEKAALEQSRLKALLETAELEKHRSQEQVLRGRAGVLDATRDARARLTRFRKSFADVLEHINGTTSELLQSPLSDEQKCVIESLLQDFIALESTLEKEESIDKDLPAAE